MRFWQLRENNLVIYNMILSEHENKNEQQNRLGFVARQLLFCAENTNLILLIYRISIYGILPQR